MCMALSNIIKAGNYNRIERIITFPSLIEKILKIATTDVLEVWSFNLNHLSKKVKIKALYALSKAIKHSTQLQKAFLHGKGAFDCLISSLGSDDNDTLEVILEGIFLYRRKEVLKSGQIWKSFCKVFKGSIWSH